MNIHRVFGVVLHFTSLVIICETLSAATACAAETKAIPLWPNGAPGSEARTNEPEKVDAKPGQNNVSNVHNPSIIRPSHRFCRQLTRPQVPPSSLHRAVVIEFFASATKATVWRSGLLTTASQRLCCDIDWLVKKDRNTLAPLATGLCGFANGWLIVDYFKLRPAGLDT